MDSSKKLLAHLDRVQGIASENYGPPVMVDIDPVNGVCNLDCAWCCQAASRYQRPATYMKEATMKRLGTFCADWGVKAWRIAGDSEPTLHKGLHHLIRSGSDHGIDMGLITNGILLHRLEKQDLTRLSWLGISLDAARRETWSQLKRSPPKNFDQILVNIRRARRLCPELDIAIKFLRWNKADNLTKLDFSRESLPQPQDPIEGQSNLEDEALIEELAAGLGVSARIKDAYPLDFPSRYKFQKCRATPLGGVFDALHQFHLCCDARGVFVLTQDYTREDWQELIRLWNGPKHKTLIAQIKPAQCAGCSKFQLNETLESLLVTPARQLQANFI